MTRIVAGGLTAGAFALGLLVAMVAPGLAGRSDHDQMMLDHMAAMGSTMMTDSMMQGGGMPMSPAGALVSPGHQSHHPWPADPR